MDATTTMFITGAGRSGTSLGARLLSLHPEMTILPQPLPLLYVETKRWFCREQLQAGGSPSHLAVSYPLGDLFAENYADPDRFVEFLKSFSMKPDWLAGILESMRVYPGQYFKPTAPLEHFLPAGNTGFFDFVVGYLRRATGFRGITAIGSKETFAEEFIPHYLSKGSKVILILRDPRDVVASVYTGRGPELAGAGRPLLFVLRQWRKSAAFALQYSECADFRVIRYEDLVGEPIAVLNETASWIGAGPFPAGFSVEKLLDHSGEEWLSNSSHQPARGISRRSIGTHRSTLSDAVNRAIEIICGPEMRAFGYGGNLADEPDSSLRTLDALSEICVAPRADLKSYVWGEAPTEPEITRLRGLKNGEFTPSLHLFRKAFDRLVSPVPLIEKSGGKMRTIFEMRASTILFNLAGAARPGYFLLPANICPDVPLALAAANREFHFVDIDSRTLCASPKSVLDIVKSDSANIAGVIYARTYGALFDESLFFADLKAANPGLLLIDDRCACRPTIRKRLADLHVDAELYSTGYAKYVDLGFGGFAYVRPGLSYERSENSFNPFHEISVSSRVREIRGNSCDDMPLGQLVNQVHARWPEWLNTHPPAITREDYLSRLQAKLPEVDEHKRNLNRIYSNNIPRKARLGPEFNAWRYAIKVGRKMELLEKIFAAGLFASSHYRSATRIFGGPFMPEADRLHNRVVNLFNDSHADEAHAESIARIVKQHVLQSENPVKSKLAK